MTDEPRASRGEFDLHRRNAARMFGVPYQEVTTEQRNAAKRRVFRYLYGPLGGKSWEDTLKEVEDETSTG